MSKFINKGNQTEVDPVLTRIVEEDRVPFYKKRNLRFLYLMVDIDFYNGNYDVAND